MGNLPEQKLKTRQLRERYRLQRRRQTLMVLGWLGTGALFIIIVAGTVLLTRGCWQPAEGGPLVRRISRRAEPGPNQAQLIGSHSFRNAPWLLAVDDERLYAASDSQRRELMELNYPLDILAAYEFGEAKPLWELELPEDSQATGLFAAGGNVCTFAQYLADPPYLELHGYTSDAGISSWSKRIEQAEQVKAVQTGGQLVLNYMLPDGFRLTGYRMADGERSSLGLKLDLNGLATNTIDQALSQEFELYAWDNIIGYSYYNVAGLADAGTGKLVCENALDYYVYDMVYSTEAKRGIVLTGGETRDSYVLWELARDGVPLQTYQFLCNDSDILLRVAGEYTAVAFHIAEGALEGNPKLVVLQRDFTTPRVECSFEKPGIIADIAALPGAAEDMQFLVAYDDRLDREGWPTGKSELYLVDPMAEMPMQLLAKLKQPVQFTTMFKEDCLIVCRGGQVYCYNAAGQTVARLAQLKQDLAKPQTSATQETLALISAPAARWVGQPGKPLSASMFK